MTSSRPAVVLRPLVDSLTLSCKLIQEKDQTENNFSDGVNLLSGFEQGKGKNIMTAAAYH